MRPQKYSNALSQGNILAQDEIHYLFPNLNKLLNFQRKFLIRLESTAELPWQEQRWGLHFIQSVSALCIFVVLSILNLASALSPFFISPANVCDVSAACLRNKRKTNLLSMSRTAPTIQPPRI
jgi:hypothetical protein